MTVQWQTPRDKTTVIGVHHSGAKRPKGWTNDQAFNALVEHGRQSLTSYSYVILVDRAAKKCEIRQMPWANTLITNHAFTVSRFSIGFCVEGNFEEEPMEPWILNEVKYLTLKLLREFRIKPSEVYGHQEFIKWNPKNATACPGRNLQHEIKGLRVWAAGELAKGGK